MKLAGTRWYVGTTPEPRRSKISARPNSRARLQDGRLGGCTTRLIRRRDGQRSSQGVKRRARGVTHSSRLRRRRQELAEALPIQGRQGRRQLRPRPRDLARWFAPRYDLESRYRQPRDRDPTAGSTGREQSGPCWPVRLGRATDRRLLGPERALRETRAGGGSEPSVDAQRHGLPSGPDWVQCPVYGPSERTRFTGRKRTRFTSRERTRFTGRERTRFTGRP
jgi:hypothetical protein